MRKFVLLLGCFAASPVAAGEVQLTGEAIKTTLGGSHLALDTPVGSTVSVHIGHDGLMSGEAGTALGAVLGASKDRGRWWVTENKVCFKWFRWFDAEQRCATIILNGDRFTWRKDNGDTGTGTIVERGTPVAKPATIVAEAKKPAAPVRKRVEKKPEVAVAANEPEAKPSTLQASAPTAEAKTRASQQASHSNTSTVAVAAAAPKHIDAETTTVAFHVPAPRPAVRPQHHDPVAVASVKPQFFTSVKVAARTHRAKVEVAKIQAPRADRKPFRVAGVDPSDVLNIRTGPSSDYETVGGIPPNSRGITITGPCQNDWCPVKHQTLVGWVNRRYLTEETAANTAAVSEPNYWDPAP
ncbi:SH3 domain-containing protein [Hyphomicrobium sp. B1]|uniref:SH3 domain-containing protein n=1 Tax=Hyphomicrobium sp. B1 TaxID=3075651 RepID=UPI003C2D5B77